MARLLLLVVPCLLLAVAMAAAVAAELDDVQSSYIVHVAPGHAPRSKSRLRLLRDEYPAFLHNNLPDDMLQHEEPSVFYSYVHAATGFAARLTQRQAKHLESLPSVLAVVPDGERQLQTTRTPRFLGLSESSGLLQASRGGLTTVIGVIDSGIYPKDRASFAPLPEGTPKPLTFRGSCVMTPTFNASEYCNNKLVGAKFFYKGYEAATGRPMDETEKSPLDTNGHGTHTASTAAGAAVEEASLFLRYAKGRAVGMAPHARIAAYKACWAFGCTDSDILSAFDEAISDGVHVISISFRDNNFAKASFRAVRRGIIVSAAAGNEGPGVSTLQNPAPWVVTVGASTIDRDFLARVVLGDGTTITGASFYAGAPPFKASLKPLVLGDSCTDEVLAGLRGGVSGKVVLCNPTKHILHPFQAEAVRHAGGVAAILTSIGEYGSLAVPQPHIIPATTIPSASYQKMTSYISSHQGSATATMWFMGTFVTPFPSTPRVASFSSRGPSIHTPQILKPDVTAPGVNVLAAWTGEHSPLALLDTDARRVPFNIISGTSMACPHVSGIVAMLREAKPTWSPAAIKSALMTTAYNTDNKGHVIKDMSTGEASTPFARGAGHVDPNRALDPGLVYDVYNSEYVAFLCTLGYTAKDIALFTKDDGDSTDCTKYNKEEVTELNYPVFSVAFKSRVRDTVTQRRRVTNVGDNHGAVYTVHVTSPPGVRVTVNPPRLRFTRRSGRQSYEALDGGRTKDKFNFGSIMWSDGTHSGKPHSRHLAGRGSRSSAVA